VPDTSVNNIVLMHDPGFTSSHDKPHSDLLRRFKNKANAFNIDFSVSGHTHNWRIDVPDPDNFNFHRIEDGGRNGGNTIKTLVGTCLFRNVKQGILHAILSHIVLKKSGETYRLSLITVGNSQVVVESVNDSGNRGSDVFVK
jgi:hypothetical protein